MTTWKEKMQRDAGYIRIPVLDNPTKGEASCSECKQLIEDAYSVLEANTEAADRNSSTYASTAMSARRNCSVHGSVKP